MMAVRTPFLKSFELIETFLVQFKLSSQTSISADLRQFQSPLLIFLLKQRVPNIAS